ncbi:MAG: hypothetical protein Q605_AUC00895G0002, partial [Actinomyces urogenitalis DORA_12]
MDAVNRPAESLGSRRISDNHLDLVREHPRLGVITHERARAQSRGQRRTDGVPADAARGTHHQNPATGRHGLGTNEAPRCG